MLSSLLQPRVSADVREELVIASHHPDRLRRPAPRLGDITDDRFQQALTWNVFRTLELLAPAFWLRRFHLRLTGDPSVVQPQILRISLWQSLPLPPIQRIDGARPDVPVDVIIETEHAVWTLIVARRARAENIHERIAEVVDAGGWLAGARELYCGVIEDDTNTGIGDSLKKRYGRSSASTQLRSASRGPAGPSLKGVGGARWRDLAAILHDCQEADNLPAIQRALARNTWMWLHSVGIETAVESIDTRSRPWRGRSPCRS
jgi:hypothetical protein